jgi:tRNA A37 threonylcarbamoyladenosine synthetase subunit TsaC/SUA5/YrdC
MAQYFSVHPEDPQPRLVRQAVDIIRGGGVIAYPDGLLLRARLPHRRQGRDGEDPPHPGRGRAPPFHARCRNLSEVGQFAKVDNLQYRLIRANTPATTRSSCGDARPAARLLTPRHTIGVRIPDHPVPLALMEVLGEPLLSSTLILPRTAWRSTMPRRSAAISSTTWTW